MNKVGFIVMVKAKDRKYFYLIKSERPKENKAKKRNITLYSFGNYEKTIKNLYHWAENMKDFPEELLKMRFDREDVLSWIEYVESK